MFSLKVSFTEASVKIQWTKKKNNNGFLKRANTNSKTRNNVVEPMIVQLE